MKKCVSKRICCIYHWCNPSKCNTEQSFAKLKIIIQFRLLDTLRQKIYILVSKETGIVNTNK